jgi:predicted nucleotidyltransferase
VGYNTLEVGILRNILERRGQRNVSLLRSELDRIKNELKMLGAQRIVQFGSSARGEAGLDSDLDLIVVMDGKESFPDRIAALYKILKPRVALDLLVYTPAEFEEMKENNFFIRNVLREGITLYEAER